MSKLAVLVITILCALRAFADVVYSGPQNIVYNNANVPGVISLFGAPGTWDDIHLEATAETFGPQDYQYEFTSKPEITDDYVDFVIDGASGFFPAKKLTVGELVDGSRTYSDNSYERFSHQFEDQFGFGEEGEFQNVTGYAGIKLTDGANTYYGWIQISVTDYDNDNITGTLIDWAYNDTPGAPILAGQKTDTIFQFVTDSTGQLLGADGIEVNGSLYNVRFTDGSCIDLYNGCDEDADFWFHSEVEATAASNALFAQVFNGTPYDDDPSLTRGCESTEVCKMLTPYEISGSIAVSKWLKNCSAGSVTCSPDGGVTAPDFPVNRNFGMDGGNETYVVWIPSGLDEVEIPFPVGWLFVLAPLLAGLGIMLQTKRQH